MFRNLCEIIGLLLFAVVHSTIWIIQCSAVIILGVPPEVSHAELLEKLSTYGTVCSLRARFAST